MSINPNGFGGGTNSLGGVTSLSVSLTASIPIGSAIILVVEVNSATAVVSSISDTQGNNYGSSAVIAQTNTVRVEIWICSSSTGLLVAGTDTITVNLSASTELCVAVQGYSGVQSIGVSSSSAPASTNTPTITAQATTNSSLIVGGFAGNGLSASVLTQNIGTLQLTTQHSGSTHHGVAIVTNSGTAGSTVTDSLSSSTWTTWAIAEVELFAVPIPYFVFDSDYEWLGGDA